MTARKVYVVMGQTGEYSDKSEWPVRAFLNEMEAQMEAQDVAVRAEHRAKALEADPTYVTTRDIPAGANKYDPIMQMDYTGTHYYVMPVDLVGADETVETLVQEEETRSRRRGIDLRGTLGGEG